MTGASLIEVMISLVILGIGILGFLVLQIRSLETVNDAYFRGQAIGIAQDVIERIKANQLGWPEEYASQEWGGDDAVSQPPCFKEIMPLDVTSGCEHPAEIAAYDHFEISNFLMVSLPSGVLVIQQPCDGGGAAGCVRVSWGEKSKDSADCAVGQISMDQINKNRCVTVGFVAFKKF